MVVHHILFVVVDSAHMMEAELAAQKNVNDKSKAESFK